MTDKIHNQPLNTPTRSDMLCDILEQYLGEGALLTGESFGIGNKKVYQLDVSTEHDHTSFVFSIDVHSLTYKQLLPPLTKEYLMDDALPMPVVTSTAGKDSSITRTAMFTHDHWRVICIAALRQFTPPDFQAEVDEFISEAEHRWTADYWLDTYTSTGEVLQEFNNYVIWVKEHSLTIAPDGLRHSFLQSHEREKYYRCRNEKDMPRSPTQWRRMCHTALKRHTIRHASEQTKQKYIDEAEYQAGITYWNRFENTKEVLIEVTGYALILHNAYMKAPSKEQKDRR